MSDKRDDMLISARVAALELESDALEERVIQLEVDQEMIEDMDDRIGRIEDELAVTTEVSRLDHVENALAYLASRLDRTEAKRQQKRNN